MKRASDLFSEQNREQVEQAVIEAESKTSCEIVPVVATSSGRYDRAEDIIGLWLAVLASGAVWILFPQPVNDSGSWATTPPYVGLLTMFVAVIVAFIVGALLGSRIGWLRRLFTPRRQMQEEVAARARECFFDSRVHHTADATGILFYVSLFERMAIVLGDQQVLEKMGQTFLDKLCNQLTSELHQGDTAKAISIVIMQAGNELSEPLPRDENDINELEDTLILID